MSRLVSCIGAATELVVRHAHRRWDLMRKMEDADCSLEFATLICRMINASQSGFPLVVLRTRRRTNYTISDSFLLHVLMSARFLLVIQIRSNNLKWNVAAEPRTRPSQIESTAQGPTTWPTIHDWKLRHSNARWKRFESKRQHTWPSAWRLLRERHLTQNTHG